MGILKSYFGLQVIENTIREWVFTEKLNFEGLHTNERHENHLIMVIKSSDHFLGHFAAMTSILMNQQ